MGTNVRQNIVTNGLILNLDAANRLSYPGTGNTWKDLSGNKYNGTLTNGPVFNNSNGGNIVFDGSNDYVPITSINVSYITIGAWVKADSGTKGFIVNKNYHPSFGLPYSLNVGGNAFASYIDGMAFEYLGWKNSGINTDIRGDGRWHYVVGTFDGTTLGYYIDGRLDASSTEGAGLTLPSNPNVTDIGRYANDNNYFGGNIALVQIYNRALSVSEIAQNYNATKTRFGLI